MLEDIADLANTQTQGETQNEDTKNTCPKQKKKKIGWNSRKRTNKREIIYQMQMSDIGYKDAWWSQRELHQRNKKWTRKHKK